MDHRDPNTDPAAEARARGRDGSSIQGLVAEALREATDLARKEVALFRTEMAHNAKLFATGIVALMAAGVFAVGTLILLTDAFVDWLAVLVGSDALASLIVAVALLVITVALLIYGRSKLSAATLEPSHTIRSVERDADVLSNRQH